jgi:hypothetical protein
VAAAHHPDIDPSQLPSSDEEVEAWWAEHGHGSLGYASLLEELAPTPAGRQAILEGFFEPTEEEAEAGLKQPSTAHRAIAQLVRRGVVRIILTTNFDRLTEQALAEAGVSAQVISRPEAVAGMKPLAHAGATVIKLHGDYKDLGSLNTPDELAAYPPQWQELLSRIFDDYGLLISGWSADWDKALVQALESSPSRRYPLYWDSRSSRGKVANQLLANRAGHTVAAAGADELFTELDEALQALDRLAEPPLTTAMAVARLKRHLLVPERRIDVHDLLQARLEAIADAIERHGAHPVAGVDGYDTLLQDYRESCRPLLTLAVMGVRHDSEGMHDSLWNEIFESLLALRGSPDGSFNEYTWSAQHYPALLTLLAVGATSVRYRRDRLLVNICRDHRWRSPFRQEDENALSTLRPDLLLDWDSVKKLPRWNGTLWQQPPSHLIRSDLQDVLAPVTPRNGYKPMFDDLEYRLALLLFTDTDAGSRYPMGGEYRGDRRFREPGLPDAATRFRQQAEKAQEDWVWWSVLDLAPGDLTALDARLMQHHESYER